MFHNHAEVQRRSPGIFPGGCRFCGLEISRTCCTMAHQWFEVRRVVDQSLPGSCCAVSYELYVCVVRDVLVSEPILLQVQHQVHHT